MLGLANALSTASSTSEQLYGLDCDGSGDFLDTGYTFQTTMQADFSWSLWVKPNDGQPGGNDVLIGTQNSSGEDIFYFGIGTDGKIFVQHKANNDWASYTTTSAIFPNGACDWTHVVVTADYTNGGAATAYKIFVNGIEASATLVSAVSEANHELFTTTDNFYIGGQNINGSVANPFGGSIDDVAIFNAVLDADAVAAVYNSGKPFDLNNDRGNYDNSSALQGYWRMGNGPFDDKVNGIVHDANNPGFADAANYLTTSWTGPTGGWSTTTGGIVNSGTNGNIRQVLEFSDYIGDVYKLEYTLSSVTDSTTLHAKFGGGSNQVITGTAGNHIHYLTNDATLDNFQFNSGGSWAGTITNISLRRLNGYPGLTAADASFSADTPDD